MSADIATGFPTVNSSDAACRQYRIGSAASMFVYCLSIAVINWSGLNIQGPLLVLAVLVPPASIAVQLWLTLRFMGRVDEFMRALTAKRFIVAAALSFIVASTWGFLEVFLNMPHVPGFMVYAVFWVAFCLVSPFIRTTR
ncbi:hypothetical protein [Nitrospirillum pindoramense]|uniref:Uncharacterized protein n=1 Tax=Nitrospirillum amazonense TaxID=28077 RepID=A0A560H6G2_9PROT|nr:hypothetical protein [Nitrospirillum amazonense]TWB41932.1 hypothetical protein FBZ90_107310 [Nitrospirillum amazonense]